MKLTKSTIVQLIKEELQGLQEQSAGALRKQVNAACWPKGPRRGALTALRKSKACPGGMSYADYVKARKAARKGDAAGVKSIVARAGNVARTHRGPTDPSGPPTRLGTDWQDIQNQRAAEKLAKSAERGDAGLQSKRFMQNKRREWSKLDDMGKMRMLQKLGRAMARLKRTAQKEGIPFESKPYIQALEGFVFGRDIRNWVARYKKKNPRYEPFPGYGNQASGAASPSRGQRLKEPFSKRKHNRCVLDAWMKLKRKDKNILMQDVFQDPKYKGIRDKCDAATGDTSGVAAKEGTP
jgi:hypothetical protein